MSDCILKENSIIIIGLILLLFEVLASKGQPKAIKVSLQPGLPSRINRYIFAYIAYYATSFQKHFISYAKNLNSAVQGDQRRTIQATTCKSVKVYIAFHL